MPLVIICGLPASGKTRRSTELKEYLDLNTQRKVHIVSDHTIGVKRNEVYSDSKQEKDVRGTLKSAVQRFLSKDDVVILDSLNYIKGFRYELYCVTKASHTPHCLILCDTNKEVATDWNLTRAENEQYSKDIFDALVMRFEEPKSSSRWDSPLFVIQKDDTLPFEQISDALFHRKPPTPNQSTQAQPLSSTNFLYELDRITQEIVNVIMEGQKVSVPGDQVLIPGAKDKIALSRTLTLAELQRHRRQFIIYTKMHPVDDVSKLANMFVQYLINTLR
ncbi:hypothetical protein CHS0354_009487 [Potamilus streckersoni]|uniref:Protein KTI12 homolog n=1 Tax=Potamilus streckersoni TaxID=2493646 RepID=A0AAE0RVW8_9BIVA|nr:hypothetical protein CHS0354_009487 [Potamilus streckersoni]